METIEQHLQEIQQDSVALTGWVWSLLSTDAVALCAAEDRLAAAALGRWVFDLPAATMLLLDAIRHTPGLAVRATPTLIRLVETIQVVPPLREAAEQVFRSAWNDTSPAMQQVIRSGIHGLQQDTAGIAPWRAEEGTLWPHAQNFPPLDTIAGRQARLLYLGYPLQDSPGSWGDSSEAALIRYQIDTVLPGLGEWGTETAEALEGEAGGLMCINRDDPSTAFLE